MVQRGEPSCPFSAQSSEKLEPRGDENQGRGEVGWERGAQCGEKGSDGLFASGRRRGEGRGRTGAKLQRPPPAKGGEASPKCWAGRREAEGREGSKERGRKGRRGKRPSGCNFSRRLSRRSRRGKRRIQSQSVSLPAGGGESGRRRRRIKDGHQQLRETATTPHFPGWSLRVGPALMEKRGPRSAEAEAAAAGTLREGRREGARTKAGEGKGGSVAALAA